MELQILKKTNLLKKEQESSDAKLSWNMFFLAEKFNKITLLLWNMQIKF